MWFESTMSLVINLKIVTIITSILGKVAIGKARYLLNIVLLTLDVQIISFPKRNNYFFNPVCRVTVLNKRGFFDN